MKPVVRVFSLKVRNINGRYLKTETKVDIPHTITIQPDIKDTRGKQIKSARLKPRDRQAEMRSQSYTALRSFVKR